MSMIALDLAAMVLALFCMVYSVRERRDLYFPLPKGILAKLKSQSTVYPVLLAAMILCAAASAWETLLQGAGGSAAMVFLAHTVYGLFHNLLFLAFALYVVSLSGPVRERHGLFFFLFCLPMLLSQLLVLTNPLTHLVFTVDETLAVRYGGGAWLLYAMLVLYIALGVAYYFRFFHTIDRSDRRAVLALIAVAVAGVVIRTVWSARVELFFEAIALFGFMVLLERGRDVSDAGLSERFRRSIILAVALIFLAAIVTNVLQILRLTSTQREEIGNIQLDVIRSDLEDTISQAEGYVLRLAMGAEQLLDQDPSRAALERYFYDQRESFLSNPSFMNVYIAGSDWHIVPGFDAPPDFHASERVWYLGARDLPGQVFITEPYLDADTGAMCFTVSTLLSDGDTVVGMDLNFSQVQESILQMTQGREQTAMIVTSGGIIAGYTDMSLVGERAEDRLPEYADVLRRVAASQEHGSFRVELDGKPCIIFSAETRNNWYLILCVDTSTLYAESYRQIATMAAVNLLMLVVVVVFYAVGTRSRRQAAQTMARNRAFLDGFSGKLHESAVRVTRLGDVRFLNEGEDPEVLADDLREYGQQLFALSDELSDHRHLLEQQAQAEEALQHRHQVTSTEAPSRRVRNSIIAVLCITLAAVLLFSVRIALNWGDTRMNREADRYENHLEQWLARQESILYMFTDMISSQPELLDDYDAAVRWLANVSGNYPDIALCYMTNPYARHTVIMSNGWDPGEDYRPETRPWYKATELSPNGFSISAPYMDAQSGTYCITMSRVVYGDQGQFLGIFGIDFFLDQLTHVLGESYTSRSYAFLVDSQGVIINHPNSAYQMGESSGVSVEDTEYAEAYHRGSIAALRDYAGQYMVCLSRQTDSGFTVLVANRWWSIYGSVVLAVLTFLVLFGACLIFIVTLINRLIRWQEDVNRQLVEAAETAVNAGKAKSRFLAQMSHEIRTPMNAIIGLDNIALRDPDISPHTREQLEKMGASARHLLSLINDILDMSRIESGRMTLKETEFSFRELLGQINVIINGQCAEKGLRYECKLVSCDGECQDARFVGDDLKLKQVIINILGNSVKFTDAPGLIRFTAEEVSRADNHSVLRFTMQDTGVGMDPEYIPKLFEPFSQENATSTNRYGGSGLGMAITKSIVDMMSGQIHVESQKGVGSTFTVTVTLPRVRSAAVGEAEHQGELPAVSLAGLHVLMAEDNEINAEILTDLLELEDMTCQCAQNGQLAVEAFAQNPPGTFDAILMDMRMPVMDGLTATEEIRKLDRPDAREIPIVALTANAFEGDVQKCLQAGMNAHLSKPVDMALLKSTLARLLPQGRRS